MSRQSRPFSRRQFGQLALAGGAAALAWPDAILAADKVRIGVQSYSFRSLPFEDALKAMKELGLAECELWSGHLEPRPTMVAGPDGRQRPPEGWRDELRTWRVTAPSIHFKDIKKQFQDAGVVLQAYNVSFNDSFTDLEIEKGFDQAQALGVKLITASSNLKTVPRLVPFVEKYKITVAMHNHSNIEGPERVRDARELRHGAGAVEALRHQPRHRPLRRRRLRSGRLHHQEPRADHQPAHQGSQEGSGRQRALGPGRHADQGRAAAGEEERSTTSR